MTISQGSKLVSSDLKGALTVTLVINEFYNSYRTTGSGYVYHRDAYYPVTIVITNGKITSMTRGSLLYTSWRATYYGYVNCSTYCGTVCYSYA